MFSPCDGLLVCGVEGIEGFGRPTEGTPLVPPVVPPVLTPVAPPAPVLLPAPVDCPKALAATPAATNSRKKLALFITPPFSPCALSGRGQMECAPIMP